MEERATGCGLDDRWVLFCVFVSVRLVALFVAVPPMDGTGYGSFDNAGIVQFIRQPMT